MNLMNLLISITADNKDATSKINEVEKKASGLSKAFSGIGKVGATAFKAVAGAVAAVGGAAATATVAIGKQAVASFANYEQLVGGVDTLFKNSSAKVQEYAKNAYATAGLSANEYMEQATSFSASLIQSLGGDTTKAAEYADRAIRDMSDNANKMGTSMEMIQNAYNGFAKQNYMMLDNLKLGYGGTKTEMERLISDASKMTKVQKDLNLTVKDGDMSFGNIVNAISVVQKKMDIMGTTAKEAMFTIQGAANSTKSAWKNVITAIGGGGDLDDAFQGLTWALFGDGTKDENGVGGGLINRVVPQIQKTVDGIGNFLDKAIPELSAKVPEILRATVPAILKSVTGLGKQIAKSLPDLFDLITDEGIPLAMETGEEILESLLDVVPDIIKKFSDGGTELITQLVDKIAKGIPKLTQTGTKIITTLVNGLSKALPRLLPAATKMITTLATNLTSGNTLTPILNSGLTLIQNLVNGLLRSLPTLTAAVPTIINNLVDFIIQNAPLLLGTGGELIFQILEGIANSVSDLAAGAVTIVGNLLTELIFNAPQLLEAGTEFLEQIAIGMANGVFTLIAKIPEIVESIKQAFEDAKERFKETGKGFAESIVNGIKEYFRVIGGVGGLLSGIFTGNLGQVASSAQMLAPEIGKAFSNVFSKTAQGQKWIQQYQEKKLQGSNGWVGGGNSKIEGYTSNQIKAIEERSKAAAETAKKSAAEISNAYKNVNIATGLSTEFSKSQSLATATAESIKQAFSGVSTTASTSVGTAQAKASQGLSTAAAMNEKFGRAAQTASAAAQTAQTAGQTITNTFSQMGTNVGETVNSGIQTIKWDEVQTGAKTAADGAVRAFSSTVPQFKAIIEQIKGYFREFFRWLNEAFKNSAKQAVNAWSGVPAQFTIITNQITTQFQTMSTNIGTIFTTLAGNASQWGQDMMESFGGGVEIGDDAVFTAVKNAAEQIKKILGFSEPEEGPLSDFHTYAPDMMNLFAKGVRDNTDMLKSQVARSFDFGEFITPPTMNKGTQTMSVAGLLQEYLPYLPQLANMKVVMDTGVAVGAMIPEIDGQLGDRYRVKARAGA